MCRPSNKRMCAAIVAVLLAITCAARAGGGDDEVGAYLDQHGLKQLLAVHLEQQLEIAPPDQRTELIERLVDLYADLLEAATDPAQEVNLEERSRKLLAQAASGGADRLRLTLLRAKYRTAEKVAENHRLRL